jgi:hypothetical protein
LCGKLEPGEKRNGQRGDEGRFHGLSIRLFGRSDGPWPAGLYDQRNRECQFIPVSVCYGFSFPL